MHPRPAYDYFFIERNAIFRIAFIAGRYNKDRSLRNKSQGTRFKIEYFKDPI